MILIVSKKIIVKRKSLEFPQCGRIKKGSLKATNFSWSSVKRIRWKVFFFSMQITNLFDLYINENHQDSILKCYSTLYASFWWTSGNIKLWLLYWNNTEFKQVLMLYALSFHNMGNLSLPYLCSSKQCLLNIPSSPCSGSVYTNLLAKLLYFSITHDFNMSSECQTFQTLSSLCLPKISTVFFLMLSTSDHFHFP